jgi:hypothetical protein
LSECYGDVQDPNFLLTRGVLELSDDANQQFVMNLIDYYLVAKSDSD